MNEKDKQQLIEEARKCTKEQLLEMYVDELEESFTLSDLWCKSQEELKESKAREEEHQRLNGELREENERLNNKLKDIKSQLDYLETYSSEKDVFEDMKRRLGRIESIVNRK